jgi:hypothetical protein
MQQVRDYGHSPDSGYRGKNYKLWSISGYRGKTCELWLVSGYRVRPMSLWPLVIGSNLGASSCLAIV